jgi:hypothetical protein
VLLGTKPELTRLKCAFFGLAAVGEVKEAENVRCVAGLPEVLILIFPVEFVLVLNAGRSERRCCLEKWGCDASAFAVRRGVGGVDGFAVSLES